MASVKTFIFSILAIVCIPFLSSSCAKNDENAKDAVTDETLSEETASIDLFETPLNLSQPVVSQKAYDRGYAEGCRIATLESRSREREYALIEITGVVAALRRNGFNQSAIDFSKGLQDGLASAVR